MRMEELLRELETEASHLSTKSLGPIGFDYRRRTKVERLLFLVVKEYCSRNLDYDLGGLAYTHEKLFTEEMERREVTGPRITAVKRAFDLSRVISDLSSSDPYVREEMLSELGGNIRRMLDALSERIMRFTTEIRRECRS